MIESKLKDKKKGYSGKQKLIIQRDVRRQEKATATLEELLQLRAEYSEEEQIYFETGFAFTEKKYRKNKPKKLGKRELKRRRLKEKELRDYWIKNHARKDEKNS